MENGHLSIATLRLDAQGALNGNEMCEVNLHLVGCPECRQKLAEQQQQVGTSDK